MSIKIRGRNFKLNPAQEEMIYAWAKKKDTPYVKDTVFCNNFMSDFKKLLPSNFSGISIDDIDISEVINFQENEKNVTQDEKKRIAAERKKIKEKLKEKFGYAEVDGNKTEIANWMVEPPGIFIGRGSHPLRGRWKPNIRPEDVTLNLSKDATHPSGNWKKIIHEKDFMWVASWKEKLTNKTKHVWLSDSANLRQKRDKQKYDKALGLEDKIDDVRKYITGSMKSEDEKIRKIATVCYIIDKLVMRVGDEKNEDEADTVGASTLRVEHVKFNPKSIEFDFLGKDSVKWQKSIQISEADTSFVNNMKEFTKNKSKEELIFDGINSRVINNFFDKAVKSLTAKVFRTFHATKKLAEYLNDANMKRGSPDDVKLYQAKLGNLEVAVLCNHKKTPPKNWEESFKKKEEKLKKWMNQKPKTEKQKMKLKERIEKLKLNMDITKKTKEYNLNTSLRNYIDPRVFKIWADKVGLDWEKIYNASLQKKFAWANSSRSKQKS